jgi:hypothetical protein
MNTRKHVNTIDVNAYCTWSQDELTSPPGDTSCFASRLFYKFHGGHLGGMIDHNTRRVLFLFLIIVFLFWLLFQAGHKQ